MKIVDVAAYAYISIIRFISHRISIFANFIFPFHFIFFFERNIIMTAVCLFVSFFLSFSSSFQCQERSSLLSAHNLIYFFFIFLLIFLDDFQSDRKKIFLVFVFFVFDFRTKSVVCDIHTYAHHLQLFLHTRFDNRFL